MDRLKPLKGAIVTYKWYVAAGVLLCVLVAPAYYFYERYTSLQAILKNPRAAARTSTDELIKKVGSHIALPTGETPEVVTVSNVSKLGDLAFFKKAINGDRVLLYKNAKMAYLYRPTTDQIINVAPIVDPAQSVLGNPHPSEAATSSAVASKTEQVTVAVRNGTTVVGYGRNISDQVKKIVPGVEIVDVTNAVDQTHTKTIVVDISGTHAALAKKLATELEGTVAALPAGEPKPAAQILVIGGK